MNKTMMGWMGRLVVSTVMSAVPSVGQSQASTGAHMAAHIEAEASKLHAQSHQWADAADLYVAAAQLREDDDPQGQRDLFIAANLRNAIGDAVGAIAALESAGSRAEASGDYAQALAMFIDGASVARKAGLRSDTRRLDNKSAALIDSGDLTSVERDEIFSRLQGG